VSPSPPSEQARARAEDFVRRFTEYWAAPREGRLDTLLAVNARLVAPLVPTANSRAEGERAFAQLFALIPDLRAEVKRWGATEDGVLIEFDLSGNTGGRPISWRGVDHFALGEDGLATERLTYFDSLPLILTVLRRPRSWLSFARNALAR
jgi:hypothetical protein